MNFNFSSSKMTSQNSFSVISPPGKNFETSNSYHQYVDGMSLLWSHKTCMYNEWKRWDFEGLIWTGRNSSEPPIHQALTFLQKLNEQGNNYG